MSGYAPLFDSLTRGTLCGRWPDIGLWPIVLSLGDKNGLVDVTPLYIAGITGLPEQEVIACMDRFCQPDPYSRSRDHDGRRLVLLDEHRNWGWRIVNHGKYKEKARLMGKNAREVESGKNKDRMDDRRGPPGTAADPLSDAYADTNTDTKKKTRLNGARVPSRHIDLIFQHWQEVHSHPEAKATEKRRRLISERLKTYSLEDLREAISGYALSPFHRGDNEQRTKYDSLELILRDAEHVEKGMQFARSPPTKPQMQRKTKYEQIMEGLADE